MMLFRAEAAVGNGNGVFDAAYDFGSYPGEEAAMTGTAEQIGQALTRYLTALSPDACQEMKYGTGRFFVQLVIAPVAGSASD